MTRLGKILPFGVLFEAGGKFFFKKVTRENGYFLGYFFKWPKFFNFIAKKLLPATKFLKFSKNIDQNDNFFENFGLLYFFVQSFFNEF